MARRRRTQGRKDEVAAPAPAGQPGSRDAPRAGRAATGAAAGVALAALVVYATTAHRFVAGGDSGELTVVAYTLGVAHPPGYPLFTLLGKLATFVPAGTIAFRVAMLSALCGAAAAGMLALAVARWAGSPWSGVLAAGLWAFSPAVWTYATTAEVFALNNLFAAGLLYLAVRFARAPETRVHTAGATALWAGLGLSNHHTLVFYAVPVLGWMLWQDRLRLLRPRALARIAGLGAVGLVPYAYLSWAGTRVPLMGWGDTSTVAGFVRHLLRADYGTFQLSSTHATGIEWWSWLWRYVSATSADTLWLVWPLALVGGVLLYRTGSRALSLLWLGAWALYTVTFAALSRLPLDEPLFVTIQARFWQQSNVVVFALAGASLAWLSRREGRFTRLAAPSLAVFLVSLQAGLHVRAQDQRHNVVQRRLAEVVLSSLPRDALLLTRGDHAIGALRYLQVVEGARPDVAVIDQGLLGYEWSPRWVRANFAEVVLPGSGVYAPAGYDLRQLLDANTRSRRVFVFGGVEPGDRGWEQAYQALPHGLVFEAVPRDRSFDRDAWTHVNREAFAAFPIDQAATYPPGSWEAQAAAEYWTRLQRYGGRLLALGLEDGDRGLLEEGVAALERVARQSPAPPVVVHKDLGVAYQALARFDPRFRQEMTESWQRYVERAPPHDRDVALIRQALDADRAARQ